MGRRSQNVLRALAFLLVAMLAWPWGLAASALESSLQASTPSGSSVQAKRNSPAKRCVRTNRWVSAGAPTFLEGDEESPEDGDGGDGDDEFLASPFLPLPPSALLFADTFPNRITPPPPGGHSHQIARLCRFRC